MNYIFFYEYEIDAWGISNTDPDIPYQEIIRIPVYDFRAHHLIHILKATKGSCYKSGIINKEFGTIQIIDITTDYIEVGYHQESHPYKDSESHVHMLIAHVRPPVMKRILKDMVSMGVASIYVYTALLSEKSYSNASLWSTLDTLVLEGAMQGGRYNIPRIHMSHGLQAALDNINNDMSLYSDALLKVQCLQESGHNFYETLKEHVLQQRNHNAVSHVLISIGPERGYTVQENEQHHAHGFMGVQVNKHILRSEVVTLLTAAYATTL